MGGIGAPSRPLPTSQTSTRFGAHPKGQKKLRKYIRLAERQGGIRCKKGWVVACYYCAWWFPLVGLTKEHLLNRSEGGTNHDENLRLACYGCNQRRQQIENLRAHPYGGLTMRVRRSLEAWSGLAFFYVRFSWIDYPHGIRCHGPSLSNLKGAYISRPWWLGREASLATIGEMVKVPARVVSAREALRSAAARSEAPPRPAGAGAPLPASSPAPLLLGTSHSA